MFIFHVTTGTLAQLACCNLYKSFQIFLLQHILSLPGIPNQVLGQWGTDFQFQIRPERFSIPLKIHQQIERFNYRPFFAGSKDWMFNKVLTSQKSKSLYLCHIITIRQ